jgi:hypothetical protein
MPSCSGESIAKGESETEKVSSANGDPDAADTSSDRYARTDRGGEPSGDVLVCEPSGEPDEYIDSPPWSNTASSRSEASRPPPKYPAPNMHVYL